MAQFGLHDIGGQKLVIEGSVMSDQKIASTKFCKLRQNVFNEWFAPDHFL